MIEQRAMEQASQTAHFYMLQAVKVIDEVFGWGYAKKNPAMVTEFMKVCAMGFKAGECDE